MSSLLIYDCTIITMRDKNDIIHNGYIYVENGKIVDLGPINKMPEIYKSAELVYRMNGKIVFPGFINLHTHLSLYPIRMLSISSNLDRWINDVAWPYEKNLPPRISYYASKLSLYTMLKKGVIGVADMHFNMEHVISAINEAGVYANVSVAIMGKGVYDDYKIALNDNLKLAEKAATNPKIKVSLGPCTLRSLDKDALEDVSEKAREKKLGIHIHVSEVEDDVKHVKEKYGMLPVELLKSLGLLGEDTILAHCVWCSQKELHLIKKSNASIALCPVTNIIMGSGWPPIADILSMGINAGFGTDVSPHQEILEEAKLTCYNVRLLHNVVLDDYEILKMLTRNSALALGFKDRIGVLDKGFSATMVIIDNLNVSSWSPLGMYYRELVHGTYNVETVIVNGEVLVDYGEVLTIGEEECIRAKEEILNYTSKVYA